MDLEVEGLILGVVADRPEDFTTIQMDLNTLEKWAGWNLIKLNKENCEVLHLGRSNPIHYYTLETDWLESNFAASCTQASKVPLQQRRLTESWGALGGVLPPQGWGRWLFPSTQCWWGPISNTVSSSGLSSKREKWNYWRESSEEPLRGLRAWSIDPIFLYGFNCIPSRDALWNLI